MDYKYQDSDIEKLIPPSIKDERSQTIVRMAADLICNCDLDDFILSDADRVGSKFLPALISQNSLEEFIEPGLSEEVIRKLIKNAFLLHAMKGYDGGVKKALMMLGFRVQLTQWWQENLKAAPNTHRVEIDINKRLFEGEPAIGEKSIRQIWKMINNTKRHSQQTRLRLAATTNSAFNLTPIINTGAILTLAPKRMDDLDLSQSINYVTAITTKASFNLYPKPMGNMKLTQRINYIGILISKYEFEIPPQKASNIEITSHLKIAVCFATSNIFTLYPKRRYAS